MYAKPSRQIKDIRVYYVFLPTKYICFQKGFYIEKYGRVHLKNSLIQFIKISVSLFIYLFIL